MKMVLQRALGAATVTMTMGGVAVVSFAPAAAADTASAERRGASLGTDAGLIASARAHAVLPRGDAASAPAVPSEPDVAGVSGEEWAAATGTGDPAARASVPARSRGPPRD